MQIVKIILNKENMGRAKEGFPYNLKRKQAKHLSKHNSITP